jgi:hypothetical protein
MSIQLYQAISIIDELNGYLNLPFRWFVSRRTEPLPYELIIENYVPREPDGEDDVMFYADELFTENELKQFIDYTLQTDDTIVIPQPVDLPIKNEPHGRPGMLGIGQGFGLLYIWERHDYPLDFWVECSYDKWCSGHTKRCAINLISGNGLCICGKSRE